MNKSTKTQSKEIQKLREAVETDEMFSLINAYLLAKAFAQTMRAEVDKVDAVILAELYARDDEGQPITRSRDLYLCTDETLCQKFYALSDERLRAAGLKPAEMESGYCPALVAENDVREIEHLIVEIAGTALDITLDRLLCAGLDKYYQFVELIVKAVMACPKFKVVKLEAAQ